jgi:hypothetical protein
MLAGSTRQTVTRQTSRPAGPRPRVAAPGSSSSGSSLGRGVEGLLSPTHMYWCSSRLGKVAREPPGHTQGTAPGGAGRRALPGAQECSSLPSPAPGT